MDGLILVAAIVASILTAGIVAAWAQMLSDLLSSAGKISTAIQKARTENYVNMYIFTFLGVCLAYVWVWIAGFHWSTVVTFGWPYAAGYAWGRVGLKIAFKRPVRNSLLFSLIITLFALGALVIAITIANPFFSIFHTVIFSFGSGTNQRVIDGYALLGAGGLALALLLLAALTIQSGYEFKLTLKEIQRENEEGERNISDDALRLAIKQRMDRGEKVSRAHFPLVDEIRIRNAMATMKQTMTSAALDYDATMTTLAYRNAEGVRRIYQACQGQMNPQSAAILVQTFLKELGLPEIPSLSQAPKLSLRSAPDTFFFLAEAQAGSLTAVLPAKFPIFVTLLTDETQIRDAGNIRQIFQKKFDQENPERRFAVILAPTRSTLLRTLLTQPDEFGIQDNIVFLDEENMRTIITSSSNIAVAFMDLVKRNVQLTKISPFITEGPTKGVVFVGRERETSSILQNIGARSYVLLGGRKIGKTSTLHQIMLRLQTQGYRVFFLECSSLSNYEEFYRAIRAEWAEQLGNYTPIDDLPVTFREMVAVLTASYSSQSPLVFVLDEVDKLLKFDGQQEQSEPLFRTFRDLSQRPKCQFIFSGERYISQQLRDSSSPLFNFCTPIRLNLVSQEDARKLIEGPMDLLNISLADGQTVTDCIIDACSRHPNLIQKVCHRLLTLLEQQPNVFHSMITQEMVLQTVKQPQFRADYLDVFWGQATPLEKAITLLVATNEVVQPGDIANRLQEHSFVIKQKELDTALVFLTLYCIFQHDQDGVKWTATHFREIADQEIIDWQDELAELRKAFASTTISIK